MMFPNNMSMAGMNPQLSMPPRPTMSPGIGMMPSNSGFNPSMQVGGFRGPLGTQARIPPYGVIGPYGLPSYLPSDAFGVRQYDSRPLTNDRAASPLPFGTPYSNPNVNTNVLPQQIYCVICEQRYSILDKQAHLQKHKRRNTGEKIKSIPNIRKERKLEDRMQVRPIVQPQQYNVQYDPKSFIIQQQTLYSTPNIPKNVEIGIAATPADIAATFGQPTQAMGNPRLGNSVRAPPPQPPPVVPVPPTVAPVPPVVPPPIVPPPNNMSIRPQTVRLSNDGQQMHFNDPNMYQGGRMMKQDPSFIVPPSSSQLPDARLSRDTFLTDRPSTIVPPFNLNPNRETLQSQDFVGGQSSIQPMKLSSNNPVVNNVNIINPPPPPPNIPLQNSRASNMDNTIILSPQSNNISLSRTNPTGPVHQPDAFPLQNSQINRNTFATQIQPQMPRLQSSVNSASRINDPNLNNMGSSLNKPPSPIQSLQNSRLGSNPNTVLVPPQPLGGSQYGSQGNSQFIPNQNPLQQSQTQMQPVMASRTNSIGPSDKKMESSFGPQQSNVNFYGSSSPDSKIIPRQVRQQRLRQTQNLNNSLSNNPLGSNALPANPPVPQNLESSNSLNINPIQPNNQFTPNFEKNSLNNSQTSFKNQFQPLSNSNINHPNELPPLANSITRNSKLQGSNPAQLNEPMDVNQRLKKTISYDINPGTPLNTNLVNQEASNPNISLRNANSLASSGLGPQITPPPPDNNLRSSGLSQQQPPQNTNIDMKSSSFSNQPFPPAPSQNNYVDLRSSGISNQLPPQNNSFDMRGSGVNNQPPPLAPQYNSFDMRGSGVNNQPPPLAPQNNSFDMRGSGVSNQPPPPLAPQNNSFDMRGSGVSNQPIPPHNTSLDMRGSGVNNIPPPLPPAAPQKSSLDMRGSGVSSQVVPPPQIQSNLNLNSSRNNIQPPALNQNTHFDLKGSGISNQPLPPAQNNNFGSGIGSQIRPSESINMNNNQLGSSGVAPPISTSNLQNSSMNNQPPLGVAQNSLISNPRQTSPLGGDVSLAQPYQMRPEVPLQTSQNNPASSNLSSNNFITNAGMKKKRLPKSIGDWW